MERLEKNKFRDTPMCCGTPLGSSDRCEVCGDRYDDEDRFSKEAITNENLLFIKQAADAIKQYVDEFKDGKRTREDIDSLECEIEEKTNQINSLTNYLHPRKEK